MGLFSFRKPPARVNSSGSVPHTADLLYPAVLPAFSEIAAGEHRDPRAVFYTIRFMDPQRSRPFTPDVLDASDFGSKAEVRHVLVRRGFVQNADAGQTLSVLYTKDAMKELLRKRGLSVGGTKEQQAARLLADGFRISTSRRLLELTASGSALIAAHGVNLSEAIRRATLALKEPSPHTATMTVGGAMFTPPARPTPSSQAMMFHSAASTFSRATPCVSCATPKTSAVPSGPA